MIDRGVKPGGPYERALARLVSRARHLLEPEEEVEAAAIVQRGVKPLYALVLMGLGAGVFVPALTSPDSLIPEAVRWYVGLPLFVAGALLMAIPGQALLILTAGTAYLVSRPPFPGMSARLLGTAPARALEVDLKRGLATVAGHLLWALPGRASTLRRLAGATPGSAPVDSEPKRPRRRRRRGVLLTSLIGAAIIAALVLDAAIETDGEEIERVITEYNEDLVSGSGEEACGALTPRAQMELLEEATVRLGRAPEPPTCAEGVEAVADRPAPTVRNRRPNPPNILKTKVDGDRASVRVGAPFAYQRVPFEQESTGWKLATIRAAAVVSDAPAGDPPSPADFAARVEGLCKNSQREFVPPAARLAALPESSADAQTTNLAVGFLAELSDADRALADELSALTPPRETQDEVQRTVGALRRVADTRDKLAETFAAGRSGAVEQGSRLDARARQSYQAATSDAGLELALNDCL